MNNSQARRAPVSQAVSQPNARRRRTRRGSLLRGPGITNLGQQILPQRKIVIVESQWTGYVAAGSMSTTANFASILPNSLVQPFLPSTGNTFAAAGAAPAFNGTSSGGSNTSINPIGYNYLSGNWQTYKVLEYECELTVNPQNSGDTTAMSIAPLGDQEQPSTGTWTYFRMAAQRFAKTGRATNGANTRLNTLKYSGPFHRDIGLTKRQWLDFPQTPMGSQPSGNDTVAYFGVFLCTLDGATNAAPVVVDFTLRQVVVVSDPIQFGN
jgi:hypothetical protein